jgi:hypothetical protein
MRLGHRAVAPSPAGARRRVSQTAPARAAFAESSTARPPGFGRFGANSRSLALRPGDLLTILPMALSMGFRVLVSLHPAIQATGRLALAPAGLAPARRTCLVWTRDDLVRPQQHRLRNGKPSAFGLQDPLLMLLVVGGVGDAGGSDAPWRGSRTPPSCTSAASDSASRRGTTSDIADCRRCGGVRGRSR